jgi:hypothetical protein
LRRLRERSGASSTTHWSFRSTDVRTKVKSKIFIAYTSPEGASGFIAVNHILHFEECVDKTPKVGVYIRVSDGSIVKAQETTQTLLERIAGFEK